MGVSYFWELRKSSSTNADNYKPFPFHARGWFWINLMKCASIHVVYRADSKW